MTPLSAKSLLRSNFALFFVFGFLCGCNTRNPETKFHLAERLLEDKKYDAAISEFQDIVDKTPGSALGLESQLKIAQIHHLYLGRAKEAIAAYQDYLKRARDPGKKREVEKLLGDLQFQNFENFDEAIASYSRLVRESPQGGDAEELIFRLGRAMFLKSDFEKAAKIFRYQKERFPDGAFFWKAELEEGNALAGLGRCPEAFSHFDRVIEKAPKAQRVLAAFARAGCFEELDDLDKAYEAFAQIKDDYPAPLVVELKMQKIKRRKILRKR